MNIDRIREFLDDLWFDLRERRLLPAVIALGVAIVAVPFVLGGSEASPPPAGAPAPDVIETQPAVAQAAETGVRTGDGRLSGKPKNPFHQQLQSTPESAKITDDATAGALETEQSQEAAAEQLKEQLTAAVSGGDTSSSPAPSGDTPKIDTGTTAPTEPSDPKVETKTITKKIVKLEQRRLRVRFGEQGERKKVKGLESLDALPRNGEPVLVLLGVNKKSQAKFSVSSRVKSVWGDGKCSPAKDACDYLQLKPGQTAKVRYQPKDDAADPIVYSVTVVRVSTKRVDA